VAGEWTKDLGKVPQGSQFETRFKLRNSISGEINLLTVLKSCACLSPELSKSTLAPGEETELVVQWRSGAFRGRSASDLIVVYVDAEGKRRGSRLRITADVIPDVDYSPASLVFQSGQKASREIIFKPGGQKALSLLTAACTHRAFQARLDVERGKVDVAFNPDEWPDEDASVELIIQTNSPNEPILRIPLRVATS
jgi:hypothetical protein